MKYSIFILLISFRCLGQISFSDNAIALGIDDTSGTSFLGNGVSFVDFDGDGWDDISLTTENGSNLKFYKNNNGVYSLIDINSINIDYETKQINWVDFDNDGDKDLFVTSDKEGNKLFKNIGALSFIDITASSGITTENIKTFGASWGDYNKDGFLDVFLSNRGTTINNQVRNYLYRNNGNDTFTDVSVAAGISSEEHPSFCSAFFDYNNDGWQDIYVSNDKYNYPNVLYKNNGDGTFSEVGQSSGAGISIDAMTVTIGDYNNDGWFDIYVTNTPEQNYLLKNNGDGTFSDIAQSTGTTFESVGWGAIFLDADNDTDLDLYVSGSIENSSNYLSAAFYERISENLFQIDTGNSFDNDNYVSYCNAIGDFDNDGAPDFIVTNNNNQKVNLWRNNNTTNNWLKVKLEGTTSNKDGIGSKLELTTGGKKIYRYTHCGEGYLSQNSQYEFFGLGDNTIVEELKVTWLSGIVDIYNNVNVNQVLNILEGSTLSINDNTLESIKIYPNPTNNIIYVSNPNQEINKIEIYNLDGKKLDEYLESTAVTTINLSKFSQGIYFIKIYIDKSIVTKKVLYKV